MWCNKYIKINGTVLPVQCVIVNAVLYTIVVNVKETCRAPATVRWIGCVDLCITNEFLFEDAPEENTVVLAQ